MYMHCSAMKYRPTESIHIMIIKFSFNSGTEVIGIFMESPHRRRWKYNYKECGKVTTSRQKMRSHRTNRKDNDSFAQNKITVLNKRYYRSIQTLSLRFARYDRIFYEIVTFPHLHSTSLMMGFHKDICNFCAIVKREKTNTPRLLALLARRWI